MTGLSARLLALTCLFVMIAEVLIYVPSIARFRRTYLEDQIAKAHLAVLALEATAEASLSDQLEKDLLYLSGALAVALKAPDRRVLMLGSDVPARIDLVIDVRRQTALSWIGGAFGALTAGNHRVLQVVGDSPRTPLAEIEVLIYEAPLRRQMLAYSVRILTLSIVISVITALLLYVSLLWLIVRPIQRLTDRIVCFRRHPELAPDEAATLGGDRPRHDEIGIAETAFREMQADVHAALRQKTRLAMLGGAVARINHDLRNVLARAVLASDQLSALNQPEVQRIAAPLYAAIDRAVALCGRTLEYVSDERPPLRQAPVSLDHLAAEIAAELPGIADGEPAPLTVRCATGLVLNADRDQLYRLFSNLILNAANAGARTVDVTAVAVPGGWHVRIADDGPGIPAAVRDRLFQPFATAPGGQGFGLGLAIAREIADAHGAVLDLETSDGEGTVFTLKWPLTGGQQP
ncbi:MAG: HAMP domain-containing histidine kinase [Rhodospirillales bacterium]|nr:HAMP domain-containing histidine kinase [Rhodospirillales bacterium]